MGITAIAIILARALLTSMASLTTFQNRLGKRAGRKAYNAWHVEYRKRNKDRFLKYWKAYYVKQRAAK
jgi:hypothetical protein